MAFPRAIVNCFLKADVLAAPKKIESAEWRGGVRRVEYECSDHTPRACQPKSVRFRPAADGKGRLELLQCADERDVDRVSWQPVTRDGVTGDPLVLQNSQTQANDAREDNIGAKSVGDAHSQNPGQPAIRCFKDHKDNQPDAEDTQPEYCQALQQAYQQSHDRVVRFDARRMTVVEFGRVRQSSAGRKSDRNLSNFTT